MIGANRLYISTVWESDPYSLPDPIRREFTHHPDADRLKIVALQEGEAPVRTFMSMTGSHKCTTARATDFMLVEPRQRLYTLEDNH
jgi:putative sterol carrier protein